MYSELDQLKNCTDPSDLKSALFLLCARFGTVKRLDILMASQSGQRQALCFFRLGSADQEQQLMNQLGVGRFGGELVVVVDLQQHELISATKSLGHRAPPLGVGASTAPSRHVENH